MCPRWRCALAAVSRNSHTPRWLCPPWLCPPAGWEGDPRAALRGRVSPGRCPRALPAAVGRCEVPLLSQRRLQRRERPPAPGESAWAQQGCGPAARHPRALPRPCGAPVQTPPGLMDGIRAPWHRTAASRECGQQASSLDYERSGALQACSSLLVCETGGHRSRLQCQSR